VLLSGESVLDNSMAMALAPNVGRVLLLATENQSKVADLEAAQDVLNFCKARKVGLLLAERGYGER